VGSAAGRSAEIRMTPDFLTFLTIRRRPFAPAAARPQMTYRPQPGRTPQGHNPDEVAP